MFVQEEYFIIFRTKKRESQYCWSYW